MALELSTTSKRLFKIVSKNDPALDKTGPTDENPDAKDFKTRWEEYEKDLDLDKLVLLPGQLPSIFVCDFNLPGKISARIKNAIHGGKDDEGKVKVTMGDWAYTCVQHVLKEVQNCPLQLKQDGNGKLMPNVMDQLERWGMVDAIFNHYLTYQAASEKGEVKN